MFIVPSLHALLPSDEASHAIRSGEWPFPPQPQGAGGGLGGGWPFPAQPQAVPTVNSPGGSSGGGDGSGGGGGGGMCRSVSVMSTDSWCQSACRDSWNPEICKGMCRCPKRRSHQKLQRKMSGPAPHPPEPRILGGWTDCGPDSGVPEWQKKFVGKKEWLDGDCAKDEEAIRGSLPTVRSKQSKREPSFSHTWGSNAILPGKFGGGSRAPVVGQAKDYEYFWLTFGGQDTDSSKWMRTAEQDMIAAGANGAAFDIEGGVETVDMLRWIRRMRPLHPEWTFVHVPDAAQPAVQYQPDAGPTFVAPMMYYGNYNSYPTMHLAQGGEAAGALKKLHDAGWPSSRIILTFQSFDAARARTVGNTTLLPLLGKLLGNSSLSVDIYGEPFKLQGPYAGVLGWPAQCGLGGESRDGRCWPEADRSNLMEVVQGAQKVDVRFPLDATGEIPQAPAPAMKCVDTAGKPTYCSETGATPAVRLRSAGVNPIPSG